MRFKLAITSIAILSTFAFTACAPLEADLRIGVKQSATSCEVSQTEFAAGVVTFVIENVGASTAEFYVLKTDQVGIISEIENIGAGLTRELTVDLSEGNYVYSCEQMSGNKVIRGKLSVTAANSATTVDEKSQSAIDAYKTFVVEQSEALLTATEEFASAIKSKNVSLAKDLYPSARTFWERIEPVAESFGDLDPKMDAREGDLDPGLAWTGWHNLEKQLWVTGLQADSADLADLLVSDTKELVKRVQNIELNLAQIANGAKELMDEVATGKVTGEEERYSHTDLWDFAANVEGAKKIVDVSRSILETKNPDLLKDLDQRFKNLNDSLGQTKTVQGYKLYTQLKPEEIKNLAVLVEAVSEPLANLTATLVK
jgi:iron uptake system component EfeO